MPTITTEIFYSGAWHDISADVYNRDAVEVAAGAQGSDRVRPGHIRLTIDNRTGRYSPRNPRSDLFGLIGRNTPLRVAVDGTARLTGEVASWPVDWGPKGSDVWAKVEASGILRRLGQGSDSVRSPLSLHIPASVEGLVAYWPMEDQPGASRLFSPVGSDPILLTGGPRLAAADVSQIPGTRPLPVFDPGRWSANVPIFDVVEDSFGRENWIVGHMCRFTDAESPGDLAGELTIMHVVLSGSGLSKRIVVVVAPVAGGVEVRARVFGEFNVLLEESFGGEAVQLLGTWFSVRLRRLATGVDDQAYFDVIINNLATGELTDLLVITVDQVGGHLSVTERPRRMGFGSIGDDEPRSWGHVYVATGDVSGQIGGNPLFGPETFGFPGEAAADRLTRVCADADVPIAIVGDPAQTAVMGPQPVATVREILRDCAAADLGMLHEDPAGVGLIYRTRRNLYNQDPALTLVHGSGALRSAPRPVDDDRATRNDVTVTRRGGVSARRQLLAGPLSVHPPPDGVGRYDTEITVSLATDGQAGQHASWRLALGTVDEPRYPSLHLQPISPRLAADPALLADLLGLIVGDRVVIDDPPPWLPPERISALVTGFSETVSLTGWDVVVHTVPESPYRVGVFDDPATRYSSQGTVTTAPFDAGADVGLPVDTPRGPAWTTDPAMLPLDVTAAGVRLTVTAVSAAVGGAQTMTVVQAPANGVVKTIPAGAAVRLFLPARIAL